MSETNNPVDAADESGLVYTQGESPSVYVLLQLKKDGDNNERLNIDVTSEGVNKEQAIAVLTAVLETMKADMETAELNVSVEA